MKRFGILLGIVTLVALSLGSSFSEEAKSTPDSMRGTATKLQNDGNFKEAYELFSKLALGKQAEPSDVAHAVDCLNRLNLLNEFDSFLESVVKAHPTDPEMLRQVAEQYFYAPHYGYIVAGEFQRGRHRGGGRYIHTDERDRVRALQLMSDAMPLLLNQDKSDQGKISNFFDSFASMLIGNRGYDEAWRLQYLTDLNTLPDWGEQDFYGSSAGAPVDADGTPIYYTVPESFESAKNDGQRWRWCLKQSAFTPEQEVGVQLELAEFLFAQFGVQTMVEHFGAFRENLDAAITDPEGPYAVHTLKDSETIARLADGVRRFTLPPEFSFVEICRAAADNDAASKWQRYQAMEQLYQIYLNRRQYPQAAQYAQKLLEWSREHDRNRVDDWQKNLDQIVGRWGQIESHDPQPAGQPAKFEYRFRNGAQVKFTARKIDIDQILADLKDGIKKASQSQLDEEKLEEVGYLVQNLDSLVQVLGNKDNKFYKEYQKYLAEKPIAEWTLQLDPPKDHFNSRVTVSTPTLAPGFYWVEAKMTDGNTCWTVIEIQDKAIVKRPLDNQHLYFVADATSGTPVAKANVEFFGFKIDHPRRRSPRNNRQQDNPRPVIYYKQFAEHTDREGQITLGPNDVPNDYRWLTIARTEDGSTAYLGFSSFWFPRSHDSQYKATRVFPITDRPVYRPEQTVHYKLWARHAQYDLSNVSDFAEKKFQLEIYNPKNEKVVEKEVTTDAYGGIEGKLDLPKEAALGVWRFNLKELHTDRHLGGGTFRVEEYKKPEFEVTVDAPTEPVMLGEKITATIKAKYYFGSPVTQARVKYKVMRTTHNANWYPPSRWDWLFGPGYWWFGYDYYWYPGWNNWGCLRPMPSWYHSYTPPEIVAERDVEIGDDGTVKVEIDTAPAKAFFGDSDHSYTITAEVVDASRRTIVGSGNVLVARKPFKVYAWVNRGYYTTGDTIQADFAARTVAGKGVQGEGVVTLYKVSYDTEGKPTEAKVQEWDLPTDTQGQASLKMTASAPGQYRLAYKVTDSAKHEITGGYVFTVTGRGFDGRDYRFNAIELVPDKKEYSPGEKVKLQINTDRVGSTVLLFLRPTNGVYLKPKTLHLTGKSTVVDVEVEKKDMPNFFIEAMTLADGKIHTTSREIVVPPEKRILNLEVIPSAETYRPGEKAKVDLRLTDLNGEPFVGSTVVTIYDKSVEYISGGSNVQDIKEFFWKWRRSHRDQQPETNLNRYFGALANEYMQQLGVFGYIETGKDKGTSWGYERNEVYFGAGMGGGMMGGMGGMPRGRVMKAAAMDASAAMPTSAPMESKSEMLSEESVMADGEAAPGGASPETLVQPTIRSKFADTALWVGDLTTDADGTAQVELDMPENLTTWKIRAWAMGQGTRVGQASTEVITRKDLILRLQAPRFFVQTDQVVLSAVVHNYLKTAKEVTVQLELPAKEPSAVQADTPTTGRGSLSNIPVLQAADGVKLTKTVTIEPEGEARVDWAVDVTGEGEAVVLMKALTDEESDAVEQRFPAYVHGMLRTESYSGVLRPEDQQGEFVISVPEKRRPKLSRLEIRYSPTLAGAMVDALPYLVDYPYGCTEQTLSRFLPTVITQKILLENGIDLAAVQKNRSNLNAQEIGDDAEWAKQWKRYDRNPVFDEAEVQRMVKDGVNRLTSMQCSDGGWGWFSGWGEHSYPHTTAHVVHGLQIAKACDVALVPGVLEQGVAWLTTYQNEQVMKLKNALKDPKVKPWKSSADDLDAFVYMVLVDAGVKNQTMSDFLYRDRTKLSLTSLAMLGLAYEKEGAKDKLAMILQNLGQYVVEDNENQTAYLNMPGRCWWCWYGSENEAEAYYLKLLSRTDPKGRLASRLVKYLLNNRKNATYWNSTRDTATCIEAFAEYLRASGESKPDMTVKILVDGKLCKTVKITPENLFTFDNRCVLEGEDLTAGKHRVTIEREGQGPVYYNAYETNFTLEDFIPKAGLEVRVNRKFYRLVPEDRTVKVAGKNGQGVDQKVEKYRREELLEGATLTSGDLVEVELEIDSKNDYEYLIFEDFKAAGLEAAEVRSGYNGNDLGAYVEYRDNRTVFFVRQLARGKHSVSYRLRAEIPGRFSALPAVGSAMYAPELKGNSDEMKLKIKD